MNMSAEKTTLRLLEELGESTGLALVKESGGKLKRATVFVALNRLEEKGLIEPSEFEPARNPSLSRLFGITHLERRYRITHLGRRERSAQVAGGRL